MTSNARPEAAPAPPDALTGDIKGDGPVAAPRAFFGALFAAVLDEIEENPDFAARVAQRLSPHVTVVVKPRKRPAEAPAALLAMDMPSALAELGQIELREQLAKHRNADLAAYVRAKGLTDAPTSKLNKTQLLNLIVRAAR